MKSNGKPHLFAASMTHLGQKRTNNEDAVVSVTEQGVFCVADGMGGSDMGEIASGSVVEHIERIMSGPDAAKATSMARKVNLVRRCLQEANRWIWDQTIERELRSCGTTAVVMVFDCKRRSRALALHAGDSRAYRFRDGGITQLTKDHSFAEASGIADEEEVPAIFRNVITRAVGITEDLKIEETAVSVENGDVFLLCSDGLSRMVPDIQIQRVIGEHIKDGVEAVAQALVDTANDAGGLDNIAVLVVKVDATEP